MQATLRDLREELAWAVSETISHTYSTLPPAAELPCAVAMWPDEVQVSRGTLAGQSPVRGRVSVYVSMADDTAGQEALDDYATTIPAALYAHATDVWQALNVTGISNFRTEKVGEATALAFDVFYELLA